MTSRKGSPKGLVNGPSPQDLRTLLGRCYRTFEKVADRGPGVTGEWRRSRTDAPPLLKLVAGSRTLYYVRPDKGVVHVALLLGPRAYRAALAGGVPPRLQELVRAAKQYPEGRAVRFDLRRLADVADVEALLKVKLAPGN